MKAPVRGEGGHRRAAVVAVRATDRGKEDCEDVRKRWVCTISPPRLFTPRPARLRTETLYEADALGPYGIDTVAADHEASPEDEAEVDGELGQGQITFLFGEICCAYLGVSIIG